MDRSARGLSARGLALIVSGGCVASFSGASVPLPDDVLAVGLDPGADEGALLHRDGTLSRVTPAGVEARGRVVLPDGIELAALSADGRLVAVGWKEGGVRFWEGETWHPAFEPEWNEAVTVLAVAPDGSSFGYGCETGQPWNDWGSYGERLRGALVLSREGEVLIHDLVSRWVSEHGTDLLAWSARTGTLVSRYHSQRRGWLEVDWGPPFAPEGASKWESRENRCTDSDEPVASVTLSPDGAVVAVVFVDGRLSVFDRWHDSGRDFARDAAGAHLREPGRVVWLDRSLRRCEAPLFEGLPAELAPLLGGSSVDRAVLRDWALQHGHEPLSRALAEGGGAGDAVVA